MALRVYERDGLYSGNRTLPIPIALKREENSFYWHNSRKLIISLSILLERVCVTQQHIMNIPNRSGKRLALGRRENIVQNDHSVSR